MLIDKTKPRLWCSWDGEKRVFVKFWSFFSFFISFLKLTSKNYAKKFWFLLVIFLPCLARFLLFILRFFCLKILWKLFFNVSFSFVKFQFLNELFEFLFNSILLNLYTEIVKLYMAKTYLFYAIFKKRQQTR